MGTNSIHFCLERIAIKLLSPFNQLQNILRGKQSSSVHYFLLTASYMNTNICLSKHQRAPALSWLSRDLIVNYIILLPCIFYSPWFLKTKLVDFKTGFLFVQGLVIWKLFFIRISKNFELFWSIFLEDAFLAIYCWL